MREPRIKLIYLSLISLIMHLGFARQALALPPEGLENFALLKPAQKTHLIYAQIGYNNPSWASDYESFSVIASNPNAHGNYFTYGALLTAGNRFADRDAYFVRYDQTFSKNSISFKFAHIDYRYLNAGKNTFSLDYNGTFFIGAHTQFYFALGMYYRFNLNRWDGAPWSPVNYKTDDREFYAEGVFGTKFSLGPTSSLTLDLNSRDAFYSYNGDNLALDLSLNLGISQNLFWKLTASQRFTGLLAGNGDTGDQSFWAGIIASF